MPSGIGVAGFDDSPELMPMSPRMPSVRQPMEEVAARVVAMLVVMLVARSRGEDVPRGVLPRPTLITRDRGPKGGH
ncbi:MAG: substrate-binding domain-containing protein [Nonomuraea sp.]|nr:substrate-binding domain-containing protein [Nonomuraea sp.]